MSTVEVEQLAVLEETVRGLRREHLELVGRLAELNDTMQANIEDRDRVIAAKTQVIEDLEAQKSGILREQSEMREAHARTMALIDETEKQADLDGKRQTDEILSQLELLQAYQGMKVEVTRQLEEAHSSFDAAHDRRVRDGRALEEKAKEDELYWVAEMTKSAEAGAKAQREMIDKVSHRFARMQDEHGAMRAAMASQAADLDELLAANRVHSRRHAAKLLAYASLAEMNDQSRMKLHALGAASGAGFVNFDTSTILTANSLDSSTPASRAGHGGLLVQQQQQQTPKPPSQGGPRPHAPRPHNHQRAGGTPQYPTAETPHKGPTPPAKYFEGADEPPPDFEMLDYLLEAHLEVRTKNMSAAHEAVDKTRRLYRHVVDGIEDPPEPEVPPEPEEEEPEEAPEDDGELEDEAFLDDEEVEPNEPLRRHSHVLIEQSQLSELERILHHVADSPSAAPDDDDDDDDDEADDEADAPAAAPEAPWAPHHETAAARVQAQVRGSNTRRGRRAGLFNS